MRLVGVTAYGISVRNAVNNNLELHNIGGWTLLDIISEEANSIMGEYDRDVAMENVFSYDNVELETIRNTAGQAIYDVIYLRVKTGEFGEESEIVDSDTGETTYNKSADEADVMPFGACVIVPCGEYTEGIVLTQSLGRNGITSIIKKKLNEYIREIDEQLRIVMHPIVPQQYMERLLTEGVLKTIRLISYEIPDDDAERLGIDRGVGRAVQERVFRSPVGFIRNKYDAIMRCVRGETIYNTIVEIEDFEIDDLKMEFSFGRRTKTISMKNLERLVVNEDVTGDVVIQNGHPTFDSLCNVMREIGEDYLRARGAID